MLYSEIIKSRFASIDRWLARAILGVLLVLIGIPLLQPAAPVPAVTHDKSDRRDVTLYEAIVTRVSGGENYYAAAAAEQRKEGYPLKPFVTMRLPTLALVQGALPGRAATHALFLVLFGIMLAAWARRLHASALSTTQSLLGVILVADGAATLLVPDLLVWHESWAGLLLALSLALRTERRFAAAVVTGLAAALIRETALAYLIAMAAAALIERQRREAAWWAAAGIAFSSTLAWHAAQVAAVVRPDDLASPGWAVIGGWRMAVTMFWLTGPLRTFPYPLAAVLVPVALLGWAGWRTATGRRGALILGGYCLAFTIFGRVDNFYWAFLLAPLLPLGLLFALPASRDLLRAAR